MRSRFKHTALADRNANRRRRGASTLAALLLLGLVPVISGAPSLAGTEECTIIGTEGPDVLQGTNRDDVICGLGGDDNIDGRNGDDLILGGPGNDVIRGGNGVDLLHGDGGSDVLLGGNGADELRGGDGPDELHGERGDDRLYGGSDIDRTDGGRGFDICETEVLHLCEELHLAPLDIELAQGSLEFGDTAIPAGAQVENVRVSWSSQEAPVPTDVLAEAEVASLGGDLVISVRVEAALEAELGSRSLEVEGAGCVNSGACVKPEFRVIADVGVIVKAADAQAPVEPTVPSSSRWVEVADGVFALPDEAVVVLALGGPEAISEARRLASGVGGLVVGGSPALGAFQIAFPGAQPQDVVAAIELLRTEAAVLAADIHRAHPALGETFPSDWDDDPDDVVKWGFKQIRAPEAWDVVTDASGVGVLISDSGIFDEHEDLRDGFVEPPTRMIAPARIALDQADSDHGTHVAGTACAEGNGLGLVGVSWGCRLYGLDWTRPDIGENLLDPLWTIHWMDALVRSNDIRVVNMSWSVGPHTERRCRTEPDIDDPSSDFEAGLLKLFREHPDVLWVAAAGNCQRETNPVIGEDFTTVPAAYGTLFDHVVTVASVDADDMLSGFSNWGDSVEVAAPGGGNADLATAVWSTTHSCPDDLTLPCTSGYGDKAGTSMATPHVAGLAALLFAHNPTLTASEAAACIIDTAARPVLGDPVRVGSLRIVDAAEAVECAAPGPPDPPAPSGKLLASDGDAEDLFGHKVAVSGNRVVVSAFRDEAQGADSGAAYVYEWNGAVWAETAKIVPSDGGPGAFFGEALDLLGDRLVIASARDDDRGRNAGAVYVFDWDGSLWRQTAKLTASNGTPGQFFGNEIALDGNRLVIGAPGASGDPGSVYVFKWDGTEWTEEAELRASDGEPSDTFGLSVAIDGDRIVVGAIRDDDLATNSGAAYIFDWDGEQWVETTKLVAPDGGVTFEERFGNSVAVERDRVVVGWSGFRQGRAYVFELSGGSWPLAARLSASDGENGDFYGRQVALEQGRIFVSGTGIDHHFFGSGSAYVYDQSGATWVERKVTASDNGLGFGTEVAASSDWLVVTAPFDDDQGVRSGSVYVYRLN